MDLALADRLRCTAEHADTWLVARADSAEAGRMRAGVLGCPVCESERRVDGGVILWSEHARLVGLTVAADAQEEFVARVGALAGFTDSSQPFVLAGRAAAAAAGLSGLADAPLILLDPPDDRAAAFTTIIRGAPAVPLRSRSARAVVLDGDHATTEWLASAVSAVVAGGRIVAPAAVPVPPGARELARDGAEWVAERVGDVVPIGRAAPLAGR